MIFRSSIKSSFVDDDSFATSGGRDRGVNISAIDLFERLAIMCSCHVYSNEINNTLYDSILDNHNV